MLISEKKKLPKQKRPDMKLEPRVAIANGPMLSTVQTQFKIIANENKPMLKIGNTLRIKYRSKIYSYLLAWGKQCINWKKTPKPQTLPKKEANFFHYVKLYYHKITSIYKNKIR